MDLKQSILLDILNVLAITSSFNMKDVCPADNLSCEEPNISGPGLLKFGKCSKIGVLLRYHQLSLLECVKECLITSQCISINYRHNWNLCDVVTSVSNSNDMDNDTTCVTSDISTWEKFLAGKCVDHKCAAGSKCQFDHVTSDVVCIDVYCKDMPYIPNAETVEPFGLQRQYNMANKYACNDNFKIEGRPFAVCQNTGDWKVLFTCVYECGTDGLQLEEETASCIKHTSTNGSTWKEARTICQQQGGDLVSIVTKAKWDSVIEYFRSVGRAWIGLKDKRWMTGESFNNVFEIKVQLNDYDRDYPKEDENTCGIIALSSSIPLQDENCYIRKRENFLCEIRMLQN
ncbi:Hypothetical predicted protein [Mytilus galloprovincialis]|uniref:C-type lectin domain-containing protein n=1 Tax=Mytilus galloprovincialis TaxID=29158 RepID=A0A8B6CVP5_MYTGA|nr:Hypothetical predicted protein [Mytilus galloprovincialis]